MCKTTKGTQAAGICSLLTIQPNQVPSGGADPGGHTGDDSPVPAAPRFDGIPEGVPQFTFISERRTNAPDSFLDGAHAYHTTCGLQPQWVESLQQMIEILAQDTTHLSRIRLVTHSNGEDLIMPFFGDSTVQADRHVFRQHLEGFAQSDEEGLDSLIDFSGWRDLFRWDISHITGEIRNDSGSLLDPFGLQQAGLPTGGLREFILLCSDWAMLTNNRVRLNGLNVGGANRGHIQHALEVLMNQAMPPATAGLTPLKNFLLGRSPAQLGIIDLDPPAPVVHYNYVVPPGALNQFVLARRAADAVASGFREKLTIVRNRLNENSIFDVRGCRAGSQESYVRAIQSLFGLPNHLPTVTAPKWYQFFGPSAFQIANDNIDIRTEIQAGSRNRTAFEEWAERSQINDRHKAVWLERLSIADPQNVIRFCQLDWRNDVLPLAFDIPGWDAFLAMGFVDAMQRVGVFFNVPTASIPDEADLTAIDTFVTTQLDSIAEFLVVEIDESNKAANFSALSAIDTQLGTSLVPDTAPDPLEVSAVQGFQSGLLNHVVSNTLGDIRDFMQVCVDRINDTSDPGIFYYMVNLGMPVFLFREDETMGQNHSLGIDNNKIVVHQDFQNDAFRQWLRMAWEGDLPSGNTIASQTVTSQNGRRFVVAVQYADVGPTNAVACPHPDYMSKMTTVTNTQPPDPFAP